MKLHTAFTASLLALCSAAALAQAPGPAASGATPGVDQRQAVQEQRIEQGKASGALTPREARRLERQQKGVALAEKRAKADGTVTPQERKRLHKAQDATSRHIAKQKHDRQRLPPSGSGTAAAAAPGG